MAKSNGQKAELTQANVTFLLGLGYKQEELQFFSNTACKTAQGPGVTAKVFLDEHMRKAKARASNPALVVKRHVNKDGTLANGYDCYLPGRKGYIYLTLPNLRSIREQAAAIEAEMLKLGAAQDAE